MKKINLFLFRHQKSHLSNVLIALLQSTLLAISFVIEEVGFVVLIDLEGSRRKKGEEREGEKNG